MEGNKENIESENYKVTFRFEFLDDAYSMLKWGEVPSEGPYTTDPQIIKENHPLMIMVTSRRGDLLAHPIVTALLRYKWGSTSWWIYSLNILLYVLYLVSITGFVLTTDLPHKKNSTVNASTNLTNVGKQQAIPYKEFFPNGPVILFTVLHIIKEIVKMCFVKMKYFCLENLIEMVAYITSLVYVCSSEQGDSWQWNLGPVAIFLAWINVAMFVKTFRSVGIHLMMFKEVFMTFLYFFRVFALFIIAFVFAFYALLQNQDSFATFWKSLLKTTAMMTGGLDYDITYSEEEEGWMHHGISYIMFFVFMIGMNITILNLLVGLAVEDIKEIKKQAELTKTAMLVELVLEFEKILKKLPPFPRKGNVIDKRTLEPNANVGMIRNKYSKWCGLESGGPTAAAIEKAINPEVTQMEQLKQTMTKMRYNQKEVKEKINNLEGMLKSLMRHQNVPLAHEEGQETDTLSHMEVNS